MHATSTLALRHAPVAPRPTRATPSATYVRRRIVVLVFLATLVISLGFVTRHGLADRGDGPASVPTAGRAGEATVDPGAAPRVYVVQPGDTLWSIAERQLALAGTAAAVGVTDYVDALVALHGGAAVRPGERLRLP